MNTNTSTITKPRKPSDAASLSALLPGLGHLYCGEFQRGILWMGASIFLMIAAVFSLLFSPTRGGLTLAIIFLLIDLVVWTVCVIQSWKLAKRHQSNYQLRDYNRWFVYLTLAMICGFGSAVGFAFVLRERVIQVFVIPTESMAPTINRGDRILTLKELFLDRDPTRGELVIMRNPEQRRMHWVKRVIAIAGDHVEWRDNGEVLVNNTLLAHTPTDTADVYEENEARRYMIRLNNDADDPTPSGSLVVPPNHCFVMGDNRINSRDSRHLGPIAYNGLVAAPVAKVWGGFGKLE